MDRTRSPTVKEFVAAMRVHCDALSKADLVNTIIGLGLDVRPLQRTEYLSRIAVLANVARREEDLEATVAQCVDLVRRIHNRWIRIHDGTWWDDPESDSGYEDDDETPAMLTADQEEDLLALFGEANALFIEGRYEDAEWLYSMLLPLFLPDENDLYVTSMGSDFDLRETRARHARCVYEITAAGRRISQVLRAMNSDMRWQGSWADTSQAHPTLSDVANTAPAEPDDFPLFLKELKTVLRTTAQDGHRNEVLFLEAVRDTEGVEGLHKVVRDWGAAHPRAYYEWMVALRGHKRWKELIDAAREALAAVPDGSPNCRMTKRFAASALADAGDALDDPSLALDGRRTVFMLRPSDASMCELMRNASRLERRQRELDAAVAFLEPRDKVLYVKSLLIAGRLGDAFTLAESSKPLGWSYGSDPVALCFSAILAYRALPHLANFPTIDQFLRSTLSPSSTYTFSSGTDADDPQFPDDGAVGSEVYDQVIAGLSQTHLVADLEVRYLAWAESIGTQRIDAIVTNLHRGAYRRAAIVLVSLAERLLADGRTLEATELISRYRTKYNRHRAFKAELSIVVRQSAFASPVREDGK